MDDSKIEVYPNGELSVVQGRDAMAWMRARTVLMGLRMGKKTDWKMIITRGASRNKLLKMATHFSGETYKNSPAGVDKAIDYLEIWQREMLNALPVTVRK